MLPRRVVITGVGMLSAIGNNTKDSWQNALLAKPNMSLIDKFDTTKFDVKFASQVQNISANKYLSKNDFRRLDPFIIYALIAGYEAFNDSGIEVNDSNRSRIGVAIGSGTGGLSNIEATTDLINKKGPNRVSPFYVPSSIINMAAGNLSIRLGVAGPNFAVSTACATGAHNIGLATRAILYGDADVMIAGGCEFSTTKTSLAGFHSARGLSTRNDAPNKASRPWDRDRDGFIYYTHIYI